MIFTGTGNLDNAFEYLTIYVLGSDLATGLYFLTLLLVFGYMMRINTLVLLVALLPVNIVLFAYGKIFPLAAGLHILIVLFILGLNFFKTN